MNDDTPTPEKRIRHAQMMGCASGLKALINADLDRVTTEREHRPEVWERIDRICELIDWR